MSREIPDKKMRDVTNLIVGAGRGVEGSDEGVDPFFLLLIFFFLSLHKNAGRCRDESYKIYDSGLSPIS